MRHIKVGNKKIEKRGSYEKSDKEGNKLVKKARQSDVRREKLSQEVDKKIRKLDNVPRENVPKEKRNLKMLNKKVSEDFKREARRDERWLENERNKKKR